MILFATNLVLQEPSKPDRLNFAVGILFGVCLFTLGIYGLLSGKAWNSTYGWFYRAKNPTVYWLEILGFFIAGGWLLWHFVSLVL